MDWRDAERDWDDPVRGETTIPRAFVDAAARHADADAQAYKGGIHERSLVPGAVDPAPNGAFATISYAEMAGVVRALAAGFRDLGVAPGDRVGIFANTRMEWAQADLALLSAGATVTTVYADSSPRKVAFLLGDAGASGVVVGNADRLASVAAVEDDLDLGFVVLVDAVAPAARADLEAPVYTLGDVYDRGAGVDPGTVEAWLDDREPGDLASLIYTSGTTGDPKGVELTHRNVKANVDQCRARFGPRPDRETAVIHPGARLVSVLPLAHAFERLTGHFLAVLSGATVAYAESPDTLREDFAAIRPTAGTSVPRVYEKIYDAIREEARETEVAGYPVGERIFEWSVGVAREYEREAQPGTGLQARMWLANKLVFDEVKENLGGNIEALISGGGTLSKELATLFRGMGFPILEGYGMTEASPIVSSVASEAYRAGTIGYPLAGTDVDIDESVVPEGQFEDAIGEFGELLVSGPQVFDGYWNMPDKTEESFTEDGYFRTGDVVQWRPDGYLVFRERSKQIIVLSTGENVAPQPIEDGFSESEVVEQCMVIGDDEKFVGALVVPAFDRIREAAEEEGVDIPTSNEEMCRNDRVRQVVEQEVERVNETFEPHEKIKRFRLVPEEWTEDNGYLTPTLKKKRQKILNEYEHLVEDIYSEDAAGTEPEPEAEPAE